MVKIQSLFLLVIFINMNAFQDDFLSHENSAKVVLKLQEINTIQPTYVTGNLRFAQVEGIQSFTRETDKGLEECILQLDGKKLFPDDATKHITIYLYAVKEGRKEFIYKGAQEKFIEYYGALKKRYPEFK